MVSRGSPLSAMWCWAYANKDIPVVVDISNILELLESLKLEHMSIPYILWLGEQLPDPPRLAGVPQWKLVRWGTRN